MKKILSLITAFSLIGGLTSCTAKAENVPADPPSRRRQSSGYTRQYDIGGKDWSDVFCPLSG